MFWRYQSLPELALYSKAEREALWRQARRDPLRWFDVLSLLVLAAAIFGFLMALEATPKQPQWLNTVAFVLCLISVQIAIDCLMLIRYRPSLRRILEGRTNP